MKKYVSWMMAALGTVLTACSSLQTIRFDQLQAGEVAFPDEVRRVAVLNNLPDSLRKECGWLIDNKVATEALAMNIADVQYFDEVVICDSVLRSQEDTLSADHLLTGAEVQSLADALGADMLFSFDDVQTDAWETTLRLPEYGMVVEAIEASLAPVVRAYVPGREKPLFTVSRADTLTWEVSPSLTSAIVAREASEYAAFLPMKHLLPHWEEVNRIYYGNGCLEMRDAAVYLRENDWDEAYALWKTVYDKKKTGRAKMKAAYNMALYHEMHDDVKLAREWLEKARLLAKPASEDEAMIALYATLLAEREEKLVRLRIQMKRFDEKF